ncbi:MAG: hypothetical protein HZB61_05735 [Nitrospirae bacterium]|nr:hypothetical protein [Nitrospirota bacterium]
MKNSKRLFFLLSVAFINVIVFGYALAQETPQEKPPAQNVPLEKPPVQPPVPAVPVGKPPVQKAPPAQVVEKLAPGVYRIGEIQINKKMHLISFPAQINMDKGLLEYLLVNTGGKVHESLFRTKVQPYDMQIAFLLLDFEGTEHPLKEQGSAEIPKGEPVVINITYNNKENKMVQAKSEDWITIKNKDEQKNPANLEWVYTGSVVYNGQFLAQVSGSLIALFHDPAALVDNASPGGESDEVWFVKEGVVPPVGTPVTITIKAKTKK